MRILHVSYRIFPGGGVERYVSTVSDALKARGHCILRLDIEDDGPGTIGGGDRRYRLPPSYGLVPGHLQRAALRRLLQEAKPELIHVHECYTTLSPVLLSDMRRFAPLVGTLHDVRPFCYLMTRRHTQTGELCQRQCGASCMSSGCVRPRGYTDALRIARRWLMDRLNLNQWRQVARVLVPSNYMLQLALQHGIPAENLRLVPHGTAVQAWDTVSKRKSQPALILYIGSLYDYKGPDVLIEALSLIRAQPWQAAIVGEGPMRPSLAAAVKRHDLTGRVRFWGHINDDAALRRLLRDARMLVLPSLIPESFGLSGIEALAAGTPVVTFALGGVTEWFRAGENGLQCRPGDAADLAQQIRRLVNDSDLADILGSSGYAFVARNFSTEQAIEGLQAVYREVIR